MDSINVIHAINEISGRNSNRNIIPGEIVWPPNGDGTYNVLVTIDDEEEIVLFNLKPEIDISYIVDDSLESLDNPNIQVQVSCPNGDINRATIKGLAQMNTPSEPTVIEFSTISVILFYCALYDGLKGCRIYQVNPAVTKDSQFSSEENDDCSHICLDTSRNIYMAEGEGIRKYSSTGNYIDEWNFEVI